MKENANQDELRTEIQSILLELMQRLDPDIFLHISEDKLFTAELGLDSIAKVELVVALEKKLGVKLEDNDLSCTYTFAEFVDLIQYKKKHNKKSPSHQLASDLDTTWNSGKHLFSKKLEQALRLIMKNYVHLEIDGEAHIPSEGTFILAANHSSHLDTPALMIASGLSFDSFVLLAAKDYFFEKKSLSLSILKRVIHLIPFDRGVDPSSMQGNISRCSSCVKQHKNLIIYPEATRSMNGTIQPFKRGAAFIAYGLKIPIVPAYIEGAFECLPKGKIIPKKGIIRVYFGKPLLMEDYPCKSELNYQIYKRITEDLESRIRETKLVQKAN